MTCIVSYRDQNKIYIGGDTCAVSGLFVNNRLDPKVFKNKNMLMGYAGSFRLGQIMRFAFKPPKHEKDKDTYEYMCVDFVKAMQRCLEKNGHAGHNKKEEREASGQLLVGYKGSLYEIYEDYQVGLSAEVFSSIGCGSELAIGAMHALEKMPKILPEEKLRIALEAAARFNGGVSAPFTILSI